MEKGFFVYHYLVRVVKSFNYTRCRKTTLLFRHSVHHVCRPEGLRLYNGGFRLWPFCYHTRFGYWQYKTVGIGTSRAYFSSLRTWEWSIRTRRTYGSLARPDKNGRIDTRWRPHWDTEPGWNNGPFASITRNSRKVPAENYSYQRYPRVSQEQQDITIYKVDMALNQRRVKILDLIREDGHAKVQELSRIFNVTDVTIRQDLEALEN